MKMVTASTHPVPALFDTALDTLFTLSTTITPAPLQAEEGLTLREMGELARSHPVLT